MKTYCEEEIRSVVEDVLRQMPLRRPAPVELEVPVEISARHVHLTRAAMDALFGPGADLTCRRELSQPGQFLAQERLKLVTEKGEIANVAVLGPLRKDVQAELSATDARHLGLKAPVRLSGDLRGAGDVLLVGPKGFYEAKGAAIVARAHVHMTPADAERFGVSDGQPVSLRIGGEREVVLQSVPVRVSDQFALAAHVDFDEANAACLTGNTVGYLGGCHPKGGACPESGACPKGGAPQKKEEAAACPAPPAAEAGGRRRLVTEADALAMVQAGQSRPPEGNVLLTPSARDVFARADRSGGRGL